MKHYLIVGIQVIVALLLGSLLAHAQGQLDLMYSPMVLELAGDRGNSVPFEITIINQSRSATAYFRSEVTGLYERPDGVYVPRDRSDWTYDASEWVELDATEFSVPPGGFYVIRGRVRIPRQSAASGYAMVVTELLPEPAPPGVEASTEYYQRFTTALEVAVGRQQRQSAYIAEMKVIPTGSSPDLALAYGRNGLLFLATLANDGDIHVRAQGQLIIRDAAGRRVRTVPLGTGRGVVIPDSVIELGSVIMSLPPGEYEAEARINYGGHRPAIARAAFTIDDAAAGISGIVAGRTMRVDVMPALIELVMPRHGYRAGTITVSNLDSTDVRFKVYVEELLHDLDGVPVPVDEGIVLPYSASEWVTIRPDEFVLRPGQRRNVVVGFQVPEGTEGGRYARIRVEAERADGEAGSEDYISTDLDVEAFLMIGQNHVRQLEVIDFIWQQAPGAPIVMVASLVGNAGSVHETLAGRYVLERYYPETEEQVGDVVLVRDARWEVVDQVVAEVSPTPVLPGEQRYMQAVLPTPLEANVQYRISFEVGQGNQPPQIHYLDLWVDEDLVVHAGTMEPAETETVAGSL